MELEERISQLEQAVAVLSDHDATHLKNAHELHTAVATGLPLVVEGQEQAVRALDSNLNSLLELVKAIDARVVVLIASTERHAKALDRLENTLGIQGKAGPPN